MTKDEAIEWAGGKVIDLAAKLQLTHSAICHWERIPMVHQYRLVKLSKGKLKLDDDEVERTRVA
jgi:DNA-binding transcriptional regulator Cro